MHTKNCSQSYIHQSSTFPTPPGQYITMGNTESQQKVDYQEVVKEVVKELESDETKRVSLLASLNNHLDALKEEVRTVEPIIKENIKSEVQKIEDAVLLRYSHLQDSNAILKDIEKVFKGFPVMGVCIDAATNMIAAITSSPDMTEIMRWQQRKVVKRVGNKVYGIEIHYKLQVLKEVSKGWSLMKSAKKDTVVMVAYKSIASVMDLNPHDYPDDDELAALTFK